MKKLYLVLIVLITMLAGCSISNSTKGDPIRIGIMTGVSQIPYIYALEEEIYKNADIEVEIYVFQRARDRDEALRAGELDVIIGDLPSATVYLDQEFDIFITEGTNSTYRLVSSASYADKIETIDDTEGARVGISVNTVIEFYANHVEDKYNLDYELLSVGYIPSRYNALQSDDLDLAILPEPYSTLAIEDGGIEVWTSLVADTPQIGAAIWEADFYKDNMILIDDFNKLTGEAIIEINEQGMESYRQYAIDYFVVSEEDFDKTAQDTFPKMKVPTQEEWELVSEWSLKKELIENTFDYKDVFVISK